MKSNVPTLYPNAAVATKVVEYAAEKSSVLPKPLLDYHERILTQERANMNISTFQGQALSFLAQLAGAKRVLEIGVFRGFSSLVWSQAVGPDGSVTGLEVSPEYAEIARKAFEEHGAKNVEVIVGDGLKTLAALDPDVPYDLIFIDAQKTGYPDYLETILAKSQPDAKRRLLKAGGLIVADNVLRQGLVADDSDENPNAVKTRENPDTAKRWAEEVKGVDKFNTALSQNSRIDAWLVPLFDGVNLGRLTN